MMNARSNMPLASVRDLHHRYGERTVLQLENWQLDTGEHQLLLGASGSGKTTLLSILAGLLTPTEGHVHLCGREITSLPATARDRFRAEHIGIIFQEHHLVSSLTVDENLTLAIGLAGQEHDADWCTYLLHKLGLEDRRHAKPRHLSRGEAQRVAIARAAAVRAPLILADEPTSALDEANADKALSLLFQIADDYGATLLVASHDRRIMQRFAHLLHLDTPLRAAS